MTEKSKAQTDDTSDSILEIEESFEPQEVETKITVDASLEKAIELYRKVRERDGPLSDNELELLDKECEVIRNREIIDQDQPHTPEEVDGGGKVVTGPPSLTRFESARIMGARALQLSLGAPPFIPIPKDAATSLDIAIKELEDRLIPITIRRVLPNGDYQNNPINNFK